MDELAGGPVLDQGFARELVDRARAEGVNLVGPGGLLGGLTKQVLETALEAEMSEHLGYDANDPIGRNGENSRNGVRTKIVVTDIGPGGEGAKYWLQVLTEIKNRGVEDVCIVVCDGLKGLPESITATWSASLIQTCVLHLIRGTFRLAGRQDWDALARGLRPIYTAPTEAAARERFVEFTETWAKKYPAVIRMRKSAWPEFVPFLQFDPEIRRIVYSTNAIESLNARIRRAVRARGHFPNEQAALKCVHLAVRALDPTGKRPGPMGHALETRTQRFQYRFRRTNQLMCTHTNRTTVTPLMGHSLLSR